MKSIPLALRQAKNQLGQTSPWLFLVDIVLLNGPTFNLVANTEDIVFQTRTYTAFPFTIELPKEENKGQLPTIKLSVSNVMRVIQTQLEALNGAIGSTVTLYIVNAALLSEDYSELTMTFNVLTSECNDTTVTFSLGAPNPLRRRFPLYRYIALSCRWNFNSPAVIASGSHLGAECAFTNPPAYNSTFTYAKGMFVLYSGVTYVCILNTTAGTAPTNTTHWTAQTITTCERTFDACKARGNVSRFGGEPGLANGGVRLV